MVIVPGGGSSHTMGFRSKERRKSILPLHLTRHFCFFSKNESENPVGHYIPRRTAVYLNVYDLIPVNSYVKWAGLGFYHSGVEVHGVEYAFGAGVCEWVPRQYPGCTFRESILIGTTDMNKYQLWKFTRDLAAEYPCETYNLLVKNCNHFADDLCYKLTGKKIPKWVNRTAKIVKPFKCVLPEELRVNGAQLLEYQHTDESWTRRLPSSSRQSCEDERRQQGDETHRISIS